MLSPYPFEVEVTLFIYLFIGGLSGVFDLPELCTVLEDENAKDLCVIEIPPEAQFADHMVIVSALSRRHMRAMLARVQWIVSWIVFCP